MFRTPPRLRPVDLIPVDAQADGQGLVVLRDRFDPTAPPVAITLVGLLLLSLIDGERTVAGLQAGFALRTGVQLPESEIEQFLERLDQMGLLEGERADQKLAALRESFLRAPERPAIHAGGAYPAEPGPLLSFLDSCFTQPDGPGELPGHRRRTLVGLVAPHVDLHRGGPTYAWAAKALKEAPQADLYVVLGTCHTPMQTPFGATRKPYSTPLGRVAVDAPALDWLAARCSWDLYADEFSHRAEHSVEFQALYLRYGVGEVRMLPLLCNSLHALVPLGVSPRQVPEVDQMVRALRELSDGRFGSVCFVAGADLAHVGPQFGDAERVVPSVLERVGRGDLEMLEHVRAGDAESFYRQVTADQDARRICGLTPIYVLLAVLEGRPGELLKYTQWADPAGNSSVTFATIAFWE